MFNVLDRQHPTATGLDKLPACFLQVDAPLFAAQVTDLMNLSLKCQLCPCNGKELRENGIDEDVRSDSQQQAIGLRSRQRFVN